MSAYYNDIKTHINNKYKYFIRGEVLLHDELEWNEYIDFISSYPIQYGLEIGSFNGGSFYGLCQIANEDATLINIDVAHGNYISFTLRNKIFNTFAKINQKIININQDSNFDETVNIVNNVLSGNKLDFLYIDGDHSLEYVTNDYNKYKGFVKDNGLIVFHDINNQECPGPYSIWRELNIVFKTKEISKFQDQLGLGILYNNIPIES